jgi:hypothetical protein
MEMLDKTNHEGVRPHVAFQIVHLGLLDVTDVS